jgi:hypothetical protein
LKNLHFFLYCCLQSTEVMQKYLQTMKKHIYLSHQPFHKIPIIMVLLHHKDSPVTKLSVHYLKWWYFLTVVCYISFSIKLGSLLKCSLAHYGFKHGLTYNPILHGGSLSFVLISLFCVEYTQHGIIFLQKVNVHCVLHQARSFG